MFRSLILCRPGDRQLVPGPCLSRICLLAILQLVIPVSQVARGNADDDEPAPRPHIVFLLADDLGWGDVGFHGGEIRTPRIDRLAAEGARLEAFYVQPVCSPTRAALMTGRYPMRHGLQTGVVRPWAQYGLPLEERTLPQALRDAGYRTAICGKWHLGHYQPEYLPLARGFDFQYGHYNGALDYFTHIRDGGLDWHRNQRASKEEGYTTTLLARESVRLIQEHDPAIPLFLYVPFNTVHSPYQVPEHYSEPYSGMQGNRRIYAGMVASLDEAIGQIADAIQAKGMRSNTLFVFSSDNGGPAPGRITSNGPLRGAKGTLYEGGVRVAAFATWDGKIPAGSTVNEPLHIVDWYPTLLKLAGASLEQPLPVDGRDAWATITQGRPSPHEAILLNTTARNGAIRMGNWKLVLSGSVVDADLSAGEAAAARKKKKKSSQQKNNAKQSAGTETVELFDLAQDPNETRDLSEKHPEKVQQLRQRLAEFQQQAIPPKSAPMAANFQSPKIWGDFSDR